MKADGERSCLRISIIIVRELKVRWRMKTIGACICHSPRMKRPMCAVMPTAHAAKDVAYRDIFSILNGDTVSYRDGRNVNESMQFR